MTPHPVTQAVKTLVEQAGFTLGSSSDYRFGVDKAIELDPKLYDAFRDRQDAFFRRLVVSMGEPEELRSRVLRGKVVGNVLGVLSLGVAGAVGGTNLANVAAGLNLPGSIHDASQVILLPVPAMMPAIDTSSFKSMQVRRLNFAGGMVGLIVIGYRDEQTPEAQVEALSKAIASAAGVDTTPEAIEAARAADFENRKAIWAQCVADGNCKGGKGEVANTPSSSSPRSAEAM